MPLNHVNLVVPDIARTRDFFEKYFAFHCPEHIGRDTFAVLTDESGFVLTLSNLEKIEKVNYPGIFHIGFMQETPDRVDALYQRLTADGFEAEPPRKFHGAWTFYVQAPGDVMVEVGHQYQT